MNKTTFQIKDYGDSICFGDCDHEGFFTTAVLIEGIDIINLSLAPNKYKRLEEFKPLSRVDLAQRVSTLNGKAKSILFESLAKVHQDLPEGSKFKEEIQKVPWMNDLNELLALEPVRDEYYLRA